MSFRLFPVVARLKFSNQLKMYFSSKKVDFKRLKNKNMGRISLKQVETLPKEKELDIVDCKDIETLAKVVSRKGEKDIYSYAWGCNKLIIFSGNTESRQLLNSWAKSFLERIARGRDFQYLFDCLTFISLAYIRIIKLPKETYTPEELEILTKLVNNLTDIGQKCLSERALRSMVEIPYIFWEWTKHGIIDSSHVSIIIRHVHSIYLTFKPRNNVDLVKYMQKLGCFKKLIIANSSLSAAFVKFIIDIDASEFNCAEITKVLGVLSSFGDTISETDVKMYLERIVEISIDFSSKESVLALSYLSLLKIKNARYLNPCLNSLRSVSSLLDHAALLSCFERFIELDVTDPNYVDPLLVRTLNLIDKFTFSENMKILNAFSKLGVKNNTYIEPLLEKIMKNSVAFSAADAVTILGAFSNLKLIDLKQTKLLVDLIFSQINTLEAKDISKTAKYLYYTKYPLESKDVATLFESAINAKSVNENATFWFSLLLFLSAKPTGFEDRHADVVIDMNAKQVSQLNPILITKSLSLLVKMGYKSESYVSPYLNALKSYDIESFGIETIESYHYALTLLNLEDSNLEQKLYERLKQLREEINQLK